MSECLGMRNGYVSTHCIGTASAQACYYVIDVSVQLYITVQSFVQVGLYLQPMSVEDAPRCALSSAVLCTDVDLPF